MANNKELIEELAAGYDVALDYDYYNTKMAGRLICPYCSGKDVIEIGAATGEMTADLLGVSRRLTVIEASETYCAVLAKKYGGSIAIVNSLIEEFDGTLEADVVVIASLLHHIEDPGLLLRTLQGKMNPDACILATVPNMTSLHRRVGAKSGMLRGVYDSTERNVEFGQPGRFDKESFQKVFSDNGFEVTECFGYMLKPFSSRQMMSLNLGWDVMDALCELGREFEELASQLFLCARPTGGEAKR